jgi:hypothetical protein
MIFVVLIYAELCMSAIRPVSNLMWVLNQPDINRNRIFIDIGFKSKVYSTMKIYC